MNVAFPFRVPGDGRTATADDDRHILDLIEQIVFTSAGERVNRPTFGSGLLQLVFAANSPEVASATEYLLRSSLQQHVGDRIDIQEIGVLAEESTLRITVAYMVKRTEERRVATFVR